jgi:hypothetical protein
MAKDPAVLFYYEAFGHGTRFMTDDEVGKYIRILCCQFDKGHLPLELVLCLCSASAFENIPKNISSKLKIDENGEYFNERADLEKEKRIKFTNSRKQNASTSSALAQLDINKDININYVLSNLLLDKILSRKPDCKKPNLDIWAADIDLMIRIDKRSAEEIKKVIIWCQQDSFWQNNILSTSKLRKQYDQLVLKMTGGDNGRKQRNSAGGDRIPKEYEPDPKPTVGEIERNKEQLKKLTAKITHGADRAKV